jgi:hypothetical protein
MPAFLAALLGKVVAKLASGTSTSSETNLSDLTTAFGNFQGTVSEILSAIMWIFGQLYGATKSIDTLAGTIGDDISTFEYNLQSVDGHIVDVIIPHSLAYLEGLIKSQHVAPVKTDLSGILKELAQLKKDEAADAAWISSTGKPKLAGLLNWQAGVIKTDIPAINTLRGWLSKPQTFATWAAPLLAAPILGVLTSPAEAQLRNALALELVDAWAAEPDRIWTAVQNWLVT